MKPEPKFLGCPIFGLLYLWPRIWQNLSQFGEVFDIYSWKHSDLPKSFSTCENQIDSSIATLQEFSTQVKFYVRCLMQHKLSVNDIRLKVLLAWNTEYLLLTLLIINFGKSLTALISDCLHFHII